MSGVMLAIEEMEQAPLISGRAHVELVFKAWVRSEEPIHPATWERLFAILRDLDLPQFVQPIAKIVTGPNFMKLTQQEENNEGSFVYNNYSYTQY